MIKFAVIEYSSKSGQIWRHTSERPNYLCHPQTEIDPTSFGCYVSALAGEHIPLTSLILGADEPVTWHQRYSRRCIKKITGSWPQTFSFDYLKPFNVVLIVHQISDGHEITAFAQRLKREQPDKIVLGVPTQPFGILQEYWAAHPAWLRNFQLFLDACDIVLTIVKNTKSAWQELTKRPVVYLPQPYPVEYARQFFQPRSAKKPIIFVAGVTERDNIRRGQIVATQLQKKSPDYDIHITDTPGTAPDTTALNGSRFTVTPFKLWQEYLPYVAQLSLVINTDFTATRGRVQVDAAATGTPSLGANSDAQYDLFPSLAATADTPIEAIVETGQRLLQNQTHYQETVAYAEAHLASYAYPAAASRMKQLVEQYRNNNLTMNS